MWSKKFITVTDLDPGEAMLQASRWIAENASSILRIESADLLSEKKIVSTVWHVVIYYSILVP